jgi:hypothetical protein
MPVVTILAPKVEGTGRGNLHSTGDHRTTDAVLAFIQGRVPTFKLTFSKTVGQKYFASTCPKCGVFDFYLHSEPGAPFFPTDKREAASLYVTQIPVTGRIYARALIDTDCGDLILKNAKRIP